MFKQAAPTVKGGTRIFNSEVDKPAYQLKEKPDDFALVVGIEKYDGLPDARFAERDAAAVREHLLALGVPLRNIIYLTGKEAGKASIEKYVESWLPMNVKEDSRVFIYFSGHGAPSAESGKAYLLPWDGDAQYLENTGYPVKRLYKKLDELKAKKIIIALDACFSGTGGRSVIAKGTRPLVTKVDTSLSPESNLIVFTASGADEITGSDENQGHGTFTYFFLKGLNESMGRDTIESVYNYLKPRGSEAARRQNRDQTPQLMPASTGKPSNVSFE